jgi:hypothetical protein
MGHLIWFALAVGLSYMRLIGIVSPAYQAAAHVFVGVMLGLWLFASRKDSSFSVSCFGWSLPWKFSPRERRFLPC